MLVGGILKTIFYVLEPNLHVFSHCYDDFSVPIGVTHFNQPKNAVFYNEKSHIFCCYIRELHQWDF